MLVKLPAKIKDNIIEYIEDGASYDEIVQGLLAKVGKSMVELESEFFPPGRRSSKDRVERVKELIAWGKRVLMLCPNDQKLLLFLVRGALFSELSSHECGLLRGQSTRTVEDLTEAVRAMRDNSTARGREEPRFSRGNNYSNSGGYSGSLKCYVCNKSGHKAYTCPERDKQANHNNNKRDNSKHSNERENKDSRPKRTKLAQSTGECVRLSGKVNGIECSVIPDTGAEIMPDCQLLSEYEVIYGAIGEPVRAQCAIVNLEIEGRQFSRRVVVATKDLPTDEVLFPIPLTKESAKQMLLGAALREEAREVGHSGDTPDTQGGATTVVEPPQLRTNIAWRLPAVNRNRLLERKL